jgi:protein-tyrosine phosphatase
LIDLHCHLLPGLDDGPADMAASLAIARASAERGVRTIVATPHADSGYRVSAEMRDAAIAEVQAALAAEQIPIEVLAGAEIALDRYLDLDEGELAKLALGGGPYLLLECPLAQVAGPFDRFLATLLAGGTKMVLAHPERCPSFHRRPEALGALVGAGALTSVTAGAFAGRFGQTVQRFALDLARDGLVHDVASDAHDLQRRPPGMAAELEGAGLGALTAYATEVVPAAVLAGERPPPPPALDVTPPRPRGLLERLRRG